ncbi:hypothetical protein NYV46_09165 [Escherichia coli]|nr:hypothetical protein [Escherichia coli]
MEWIADPSIWAGLITLIVIELVLGIDNLVFIAILAEKLPPKQRDRARVTGLLLAMLMRLLLLASISWLVTLTQPLFSFRSFTFSARDLIMLFGGFFLLFKATMELNERLEGKDSNNPTQRKGAKFWGVVTQIVVLDAIFSLDSVITAVGMDREYHTIAGLLMEYLQRIPKPGEEVQVGDYLLKTLQVESHRVQKVQIIPLHKDGEMEYEV